MDRLAQTICIVMVTYMIMGGLMSIALLLVIMKCCGVF